MTAGLLRSLVCATLAGAALACSGMALALDYRSVAAPSILYDAPSTQGKPLHIINAGTPVEAVVSIEGWTKVRDIQGALAWIEKKQLSDKRMVQVRVDRAAILAQPNDKATPVFEAERDVVLELLESTGTGWVQVRHRDGQTGYVKTLQVWGL